jgi:hypothetical protein
MYAPPESLPLTKNPPKQALDGVALKMRIEKYRHIISGF